MSFANQDSRAWIFAAGLVLGFSLLAEEGVNPESRDAFDGSRRLLSSLGRLSPQAAQYYRILSSFSEAIDTYRRQLQSERRDGRASYVERILSLEPGADSNGGQQNMQPQPAASGTASVEGSGAGDDDYEDSAASPSNSMSLPPLPAGDEDLMLRLLWEGYNINFMDTTNVLEEMAPPI